MIIISVKIVIKYQMVIIISINHQYCVRNAMITITNGKKSIRVVIWSHLRKHAIVHFFTNMQAQLQLYRLDHDFILHIFFFLFSFLNICKYIYKYLFIK
jgi:hypothetical protein